MKEEGVASRNWVGVGEPGMGLEVAGVWQKWLERLARGPVTLLGRVAPHVGLHERSLAAGALELADGAMARGPTAVPMSGLPPQRLHPAAAGSGERLDLTLPVIRRLRALIRMAKMEQRRVIVVAAGHDDIAATVAGDGATVISCAEEVMKLGFAPRTALLAHPYAGGGRFRAVAGVLKRRFPDGDLNVMDTRDPALIAREKAVETAARGISRLVVLGDGGLDASVTALYEAARWAGVEAHIASTPSAAADLWCPGAGLACGIFTPREDWEDCQPVGISGKR